MFKKLENFGQYLWDQIEAIFENKTIKEMFAKLEDFGQHLWDSIANFFSSRNFLDLLLFGGLGQLLWDQITAIFNNKTIKDMFSSLGDFGTHLWSQVTAIFSVKTITDLFTSLGNFGTHLWSQVTAIFSVKTFTDLFTSLGNFGTKMWNDIVGVFTIDNLKKVFDFTKLSWPTLPSLSNMKWPDFPKFSWPEMPKLKMPEMGTLKMPAMGTLKMPEMGTLKMPAMGTLKLPTMPSLGIAKPSWMSSLGLTSGGLVPTSSSQFAKKILGSNQVTTQLSNMAAKAASAAKSAAKNIGSTLTGKKKFWESGGPVYANKGFFVPSGTDTVPAMLTPGEFVINREATKNNLDLLSEINGSRKKINVNPFEVFKGLGSLKAENGIDKIPGSGITDNVPVLARPGERILTPKQAKSMDSGSGAITLNIEINMAPGSKGVDKNDIKEMGEKIIEYIRRESKNGRNILRPSGVY